MGLFLLPPYPRFSEGGAEDLLLMLGDTWMDRVLARVDPSRQEHQGLDRPGPSFTVQDQIEDPARPRSIDHQLTGG
jgi:hypothetical protein